ncbi:MAG: hypothetical protein WAN69_17700 [Candidatus Korobacteraceae bacterium]
MSYRPDTAVKQMSYYREVLPKAKAKVDALFDTKSTFYSRAVYPPWCNHE